ncbi:hypothetical protein EE612_026905, partial [Oryza sativa]
YRTPAHLVSISAAPLVTPACRPSHAVNLAAHARHHRLRRARRPALVALAVMADPLASLARAME